MIGRNYLSAGVSVYVQGIVAMGNEAIPYGNLGWVPAYSVALTNVVSHPITGPTSTQRQTAKTKGKSEERWDTKVFRNSPQ